MVNGKKIKVVWICSVSNPELRSHLDLYVPFWYRLLKRIIGKSVSQVVPDYAQWNSNAIDEFKTINEVDLHVIFVHRLLRKKIQCFNIGNIHFYAVKADDYSLFGYMRMRLFGAGWINKRSNRTIAKIASEIDPDIIHVMGAEMLEHSPSLLLLPKDVPNIVQLETMLHDPVALQFYPELSAQKVCEGEVIRHADYIGHASVRFPKIVRNYIKKEAIFVNTRLMIGEKENLTPCEKSFDFVYFANYVNKSVDLAIEAFGIAYRQNSSLTLDIIGSINDEERVQIMSRLQQLGCISAVTIEGKLPTHEDVIQQIRKSRFALLPLKLDAVSGTIREAMWNGLPVITTRTVGTPLLNENRESVLVSEIGDHKALAENMLRLIEDSELATKLRNNAIITVDEKYGNNPKRAQEWLRAYYACIDNFHYRTPIPECVLNRN